MKANLLFLFALYPVALFGQGTINFSNGTAMDQRIYETPGVLALVGTKYMFGLYYAPDGTTDQSQFIQLGASTGIAGPEGSRTGIFTGGNRTAPTAVPGGFGMFQVRGWESAYGNTYEAVLSSGQPACVGKSNIVRVDTGNPTTVPPETPASLVNGTGFRGFIICIPEPSTTLLSAMGVGAILLYLACSRSRITWSVASRL
jgi:hypothetical protein